MTSCQTNEERRFTFTMSLPDRLRKRQRNLPLLDSNELDRHDDGMELSSRLGQRSDWVTCKRQPQESESIKSYRKSCSRCSNTKPRSIARATRTECCESTSSGDQESPGGSTATGAEASGTR